VRKQDGQERMMRYIHSAGAVWGCPGGASARRACNAPTRRTNRAPPQRGDLDRRSPRGMV